MQIRYIWNVNMRGDRSLLYQFYHPFLYYYNGKNSTELEIISIYDVYLIRQLIRGVTKILLEDKTNIYFIKFLICRLVGKKRSKYV